MTQTQLDYLELAREQSHSKEEWKLMSELWKNMNNEQQEEVHYILGEEELI